MAWCPKCKNEYREGIKVCADCGCELVDEKELMDDDLEEVNVPEEVFSESLVADLKENESQEDSRPEVIEHYQNSAQRAEENRSSAWMLILLGGAGLVVSALGIFGIFPLRLGNPYLFYTVLIALFLVFLVMGIVSIQNAKKFDVKAEYEATMRLNLLEWCKEKLRPEVVDCKIADVKNMPDEIVYFKRVEVVKSMINDAFPELNQAFLDHMIDSEIYDMLFSEKE